VSVERVKRVRPKVLRFRASERRLHWAIAIPFLVCYVSALVLVVVYNPDPLRPYRAVFSWAHRISGICLIVFPLWAGAGAVKDFRVHFYNIRQAWIWIFDDLKWLALMGLAAISRRIKLPEQGKFNAAQKLNFMLVMSTYPLYIATGLLMWVTGAALLAWLLHFAMALIATPFLAGHIFMATIPKSSRKALPGMVTGMVERDWAQHHHRRWYEETFVKDHRGAKERPHATAPAVVEPRPAAAAAPASAIPSRLAALERCAQEGETARAADLFRALWPHVREVELAPDALRGIIADLMRRADLTAAARASGLLILRGDPDPLAVTCLLKTAEASRAVNGGAPARGIYAFLLKHCPDSPYVGYFRKGLEELQGAR
jgi:formate dehydrogenase subunit gamma